MESTARRLALLGTLLASSLALGGGCGDDDSLPETLVLGSPAFCSDTYIDDFAVDGSIGYILERSGETDTRLLRTDFDGETVILLDSLQGFGSRIRVVGSQLQWQQVTSPGSYHLLSFDRDRGEVVRLTTFAEAVELLDLQDPNQMIGAGTSEEPARILISDSVGVFAADLESGQSVVVAPPENGMSLYESSSSSKGTVLRLGFGSGELLVIGERLDSVAVVPGGGGGVLAGTDGILYVNGEDLELLTWGTLERIPLGATFPDSQVGFGAPLSDYEDRENWALLSGDPSSGLQQIQTRVDGRDHQYLVPKNMGIPRVRVGRGQTWVLETSSTHCIAPIAQD